MYTIRSIKYLCFQVTRHTCGVTGHVSGVSQDLMKSYTACNNSYGLIWTGYSSGSLIQLITAWADSYTQPTILAASYGLIQTVYSSSQLVQSGYPSGGLVLNSQHFVCIHKVTGHMYNLAITIYGFAGAATLAFHPDSAGLLWSDRSASILTFIT